MINLDKIEYAIYYATKAHKGQRRKMEDVDILIEESNMRVNGLRAIARKVNTF